MTFVFYVSRPIFLKINAGARKKQTNHQKINKVLHRGNAKCDGQEAFARGTIDGAVATRRDGLHSLTYTHYDGAEDRMRQTPRHRHAKQLNERPNYQIHTCWQYIGEGILAHLEGSRQT